MYNKFTKDSKLTAFQPVIVPKVRDIFRRRGYQISSQCTSGGVADFSRNPLESFDGENRRMSQHYYEKYVEMMEREEAQKEAALKEDAQKAEAQKAEKSVDNQIVEDKKV